MYTQMYNGFFAARQFCRGALGTARNGNACALCAMAMRAMAMPVVPVGQHKLACAFRALWVWVSAVGRCIMHLLLLLLL